MDYLKIDDNELSSDEILDAVSCAASCLEEEATIFFTKLSQVADDFDIDSNELLKFVHDCF